MTFKKKKVGTYRKNNYSTGSDWSWSCRLGRGLDLEEKEDQEKDCRFISKNKTKNA